ncbi:tetratricopeptide repeat protein [Paenibacillus sp. TRM 82003]|uniref:co-chaperone YbbN n=1 Tax=Kineococcus sp. TRM81007 TaxID=2925831 RepID=UPI001F5937A5|nr:tetratricopeptide repeat protein [Kineococcus sp. TRM81007]MCI2239325.1 tetratricopeptide repeat protein [Kineococcus sp. TRM81007]MCI3925009.1 tetratricopeptide repeat protein [Paenibacillus sp. TRM 82003]
MTQPTPPGAGLNLRGAVDLGALAARNSRREEVARRASADPDSAQQASPFVVDVTEESFAEVVQRSVEFPVVLDLWAEGYDTGSEVLAQLAGEFAGRFLLGRIDVQAEPALAQSLLQSLQARSVPLVAAIVKGQPLPLFTGAYPPAEEARPLLEEVLRVAEANGVTGRVAGEAPAETPEPEQPSLPPLHAEAQAAAEAGDYDAAAAAWRKVLASDPRDAAATEGLARVEVLRRLSGVDAGAARAAAADAPDDVTAQIVVADLDLVGGHVEDAFERLLRIVRRAAGEDRDAARAHLLELFTVVGAGDPRVATARTALSRALF